MFLAICMQIYSVVFALSRQINKQKVCENSLTSFAQVIKFCKISSSRGGLTPPPLAYALGKPSPTLCTESEIIFSPMNTQVLVYKTNPFIFAFVCTNSAVKIDICIKLTQTPYNERKRSANTTKRLEQDKLALFSNNITYPETKALFLIEIGHLKHTFFEALSIKK